MFVHLQLACHGLQYLPAGRALRFGLPTPNLGRTSGCAVSWASVYLARAIGVGLGRWPGLWFEYRQTRLNPELG